jgi:hypothetical protein
MYPDDDAPRWFDIAPSRGVLELPPVDPATGYALELHVWLDPSGTEAVWHDVWGHRLRAVPAGQA